MSLSQPQQQQQRRLNPPVPSSWVPWCLCACTFQSKEEHATGALTGLYSNLRNPSALHVLPAGEVWFPQLSQGSSAPGHSWLAESEGCYAVNQPGVRSAGKWWWGLGVKYPALGQGRAGHERNLNRKKKVVGGERQRGKRRRRKEVNGQFSSSSNCLTAIANCALAVTKYTKLHLECWKHLECCQ